MRTATTALLFLAAAAFAAEQPQAFRLAPGDFRWVEFTVRQVPTLVECRYSVVSGGATVRAELLPRSEFTALYRGREHHAMTTTPASSNGSFRQVVDEPGRYALVLLNEPKAAPAMVSLDFRTEINPRNDEIARALPAGRRLTVILISFAVFFVTAGWSGRALLRATRRL